MKKYLAEALALLRNPTVRPYEVWAVRAILVYVGGKLGVDFVHAVGG